MAQARKSSPALVASALFVLLFLTLQGWVAIRNGLSDIHARPAINYLEDRIAADFRISEAEWQAVYDSVSRADELMPRNPNYLENLGRLQQIKRDLVADDLNMDQVDALTRAVEDYYRGAVAARPTWPYFWGSLALKEYRRGNYDTDDYSVALANAARFGPWKNDIQRLVADLGSETPQLLSPRAQREFLLNLERGLSRQPDTMFEIIRNWERICETANIRDVSLPLLLSQCERDGY